MNRPRSAVAILAFLGVVALVVTNAAASGPTLPIVLDDPCFAEVIDATVTGPERNRLDPTDSEEFAHFSRQTGTGIGRTTGAEYRVTIWRYEIVDQPGAVTVDHAEVFHRYTVVRGPGPDKLLQRTRWEVTQPDYVRDRTECHRYSETTWAD